MKVRYVIFLLLLPYVAEAILSCTEEEPLCESANEGGYKLKNVTAMHLKYDGSSYTLASTEIKKSAYGLLVNLERDFQSISMTSPRRSFSMFPAAFACSPPIETYPLDTLTDFKITALQKFDDTHEAGADVSDLFEIVDLYMVNTLNDYVNYFGESLEQQSTTFTIRLKTPPTSAGPFEFKLIVSLKDGRTLEATTTPIKLVE